MKDRFITFIAMDRSIFLSGSRPPRMHLVIRLILGLLIGALTLWWTMRNVEPSAISQSLRGVSLTWLMISGVGVVAVTAAKAARWEALYGPTNVPVLFRDLFSSLVIAQMVNVMIPIRLGELIRIGLMKQAGQSSPATLSTLVVEKVIDLTITGLLVVILVKLAVTPAWLRAQMGEIILVGLMLILGLLLTRQFSHLFETKFRALINRDFLPGRWQKHILDLVSASLDSFHTLLADKRSQKRILLWTICIWLLSLLTMMALLIAFELILPLSAALVMMLAVNSSNIIPSPPALIGLMQLIAVTVLGQYGVPQTVSVAFGIILNIVVVFPIIVLGSWLLLSRLMEMGSARSWIKKSLAKRIEA